MKIIKKICALAKTLNNPFLFLYKMFHYGKLFMPYSLARFINQMNVKQKSQKSIVDFYVNTYDGSGQIVHPDLIFYKGLYWLAFTPYPYGMDEYENPCVYASEHLESISYLSDNPIAMPHKRKYGFHLSDPCIAGIGERLVCIYRESEKLKDGVEKTTLLMKEYKGEKLWSKPLVVCSSKKQLYLSPSLLFSDCVLYCYYAEWNYDSCKLFLLKMDDNCLVQSISEIQYFSTIDGFYPWHIAIVYKDTLDKFGKLDDELIGLFLLKSYDTPAKFKLFLAESSCIGCPWQIVREILPSNDINEEIKIIYKSCFIPKSNNILLNFRDKNDRYRTTVISID